MVKHSQTIRRQMPTNCLSVFDHFVGLALKRLFKKEASPLLVSIFIDNNKLLFTIDNSKFYLRLYDSKLYSKITFLMVNFLRSRILKVGISPSKKVVFICLNESPLKRMKN